MRKRSITLTEVLAGLVGCGLIAALFIAAFYDPGKPRLNPATLCPVTAPAKPSAINVVVVDESEPYNTLQQSDIIQTLAGLAGGSETGDMFLVLGMGVQAGLTTTPVATLCNPGGVKETSLSDRMDTTEISKRQFEERFLGALKGVVQKRLDHGPLANSPLMEMIQGVQVTTIKPSSARHQRLIIVSDLMQHSSHFSQYGRDRSEWPAFRASPAFDKLAVDLSGVSVMVLYVPRHEGASKQPPGHREFWANYFSALGAREVRFSIIEGGAWTPSPTGKAKN